MTKTNVPRLRFSEFSGEWREEKLGDLAEIIRGASPRPIKDKKWFSDDSDIGWIRISDVTNQNGKIKKLHQHLSIEGQKKTRILKTPHLLLSIAASVGKPVINYVPTGVHDGFLIFKHPEFNIDYMYAYLEYYKKRWNKYGQPGSQVNLNSDIVKNSQLFIPFKEEQIMISHFINKQDKLIELQTQKVDQLKKLKRGYLQKMFPQEGEAVPRLRFSGFSEEWKEVTVGEIVSYNNQRNKSNNISNVESISNKQGFVRQTNQFKDYSVASSDLSNYFVISQGMFAYNPSRINVGSIAYKDYDQEASVVSPLYISFKTKKIIDDEFFLYWFKTDTFRMNREKYSEGGVRDTLSFKLLSQFDFRIPNFDEQQKIGSFLAKLDKLIEEQSDKLDQLKQQKKAYLQKMFI